MSSLLARLLAAGCTCALLLVWLPGPAGADDPVLVVQGDVQDGLVQLRPATMLVDESQPRLEWHLANGGTDTLTFRLSLHEVVVRGGATVAGGSHSNLALPTDTVNLGAGEIARIRVDVPPAVFPGAVALVARTTDATPQTEVSALALLGAAEEVDARVVDHDASAGRVTVRLTSGGPTLVDVAVRVTAWPGVASREHVAEQIMVAGDQHDLDVDVRGLLFGRLTVEVAATGMAAATSTTVWWWPRVAVAALIVALVVLTLVLVAAVLVRRRARVSP